MRLPEDQESLANQTEKHECAMHIMYRLRASISIGK